MLQTMELAGYDIEINKLNIIMEDAMNGEQRAIQIVNEIIRELDTNQERRAYALFCFE
ncbi:hypothetical protein [Bacillus wiedmannii]|uniref:hypothetical protein n=1 Tax=Bacillus wiedmannii TaxID=1890302 RepID=UPI0015CF2152|nr:hypothetical protein [Bacillus wiedmannii]